MFSEPAYPTVEAKAAHLLYFVIKNHPFSDGNKRSAAFLFVDFFNRNARLLGALIRKAEHAEINDRFGHPVVPREWFLVPLFVIDEVIEKIKDGTISEYVYDTESAALVSDNFYI